MTKTGIDENKYKSYRNTLQKIIRIAKCECYTNQCLMFKNNTKKLWQVINSITRKTYDKTCLIESLKVQNLEYDDGKNIMAAFENYFSTVGSTFASKINPSKLPINKYVSNIKPNEHSVFLLPCDKNELNRLINKLPNKKSAGYDGVSNVLLKEIKDYILEPLVSIFNNSLTQGIFPKGMKHSEIVPLFKSGLKNQTTNYRPISLLIIILKILEKIMYSRVYDFLNENQIYRSQYGFRKYHSCEKCSN